MQASVLMKSLSSFRSVSLQITKKSLRNWLLGVVQRSNFFHFQKLTFGIDSTEQFHIHTVKSGETLTSISKKHGTPIYTIAAANTEIKDVDFVMEGQKLNIPINVDLQKIYNYQLDRYHSLLDKHLIPKSQLICTITSTFPSQTVKPSCYFVVLALLLAFCIGCGIEKFRISLAKSPRPHGANGVGSCETRSRRWKAVIYDSEFIDNSDAAPLEKSCKPSEEQPQLFGRSHQEYAKVESEYSKFLSDCGVRSYGYWRGGTAE